MTLALLVAILTALLLLFSMIPYSVSIESHGGVTRVRWAIAGLRLPARGSSPNPKGSSVRSPKTPRPKRRGKRSLPLRKLRALLFSRDFVPSLIRLARRVLRQLRPRRLRVRSRFGLGDPFDTARIWGILSPLLLSLSSLEAEEIWLEPDFSERSFRLDLSTEVRVIPLILMVLVFSYFLTPAPWRAVIRFARA